MLEWLSHFLERRVALVLEVTIGVDVLFQVVQTAELYEKDSSLYIFEAVSLGMLVASMLYFAWSSIVKENAFELLSFLSFACIVNFHGIYMSATHLSSPVLAYVGYVVQGLCQLLYFVTCYSAYQTFGWRMISEAQTTNMVLLSALKIYETFVAVLKVDFILCLMICATYNYYILVDWMEVAYIFCPIAALILLAFLAYFILGVVSVIKEHKPGFVLFLIFDPFCEALKLYFAVTILLAPSREVDQFVLIQFLVLAIADFAASVLVLGLGLLLLKSFKQGLRTILERVERKGLVKPFI